MATEISLPTNTTAIACGRSFIREYAKITCSTISWLNNHTIYNCIFNWCFADRYEYSDIDPGFFTFPTCPVSKEEFKNCVCFIKMKGDVIKFKKRENFLQNEISESEFWKLFNEDTGLRKS